MTTNIKQKQVVKTINLSDGKKSMKTTLTIFEYVKGDKTLKITVDSNKFLKDPMSMIHFLAFYGFDCKAVKEDGASFEEYKMITANALGAETAWGEMSRTEKLKVSEIKLAWVNENYNITLTDKITDEEDMLFSNKDLGNPGYQGIGYEEGLLKRDGIDFAKYRQKMYAGTGKATVEYSDI